ncbi:MAG: hypothetical protein K0Q59_5985 [Paenibacillus sp.]|nr:hypothetical protein [Paenibacillus sp.]
MVSVMRFWDNILGKVRNVSVAHPLPVTGSVSFSGSFLRTSSEAKPTGADGAKDGDSLLLVDTRQVFKFYNGGWWEL